MNTIRLDEIPNPLNVPREPASDPDYIKHVSCEGARFHVKSYSNLGTRCSEPKCILNKWYKERQQEKEND